MSSKKADVEHPVSAMIFDVRSKCAVVGYNAGEQHLGKPKVSSSEESSGPQAGTHGQPDSHVSGQGGPEIMGGSASTRILGQSVDEQLKTTLPTNDGNK